MKSLPNLFFLLLISLTACNSQTEETSNKANESKTSQTSTKLSFDDYESQCGQNFKQTVDNINQMQPKDASDFIFPSSLQESFYNNSKVCLSIIENYISAKDCSALVESSKAILDKTKVDIEAYGDKKLETISDRLHAFKGAKDLMVLIDDLKTSSESTFNADCVTGS